MYDPSSSNNPNNYSSPMNDNMQHPFMTNNSDMPSLISKYGRF